MTNELCHEHSGVCARIEKLEDDVRTLFSKWDGNQKLLLGTLVSTITSLLGVIFLLLKSS